MTPHDPFDVARAAYARSVSVAAGIDDEAVLRALQAVPREASLGPPPWKVRTATLRPSAHETADPRMVLHDVAVECANGHVQPAPDRLALLLHEARIKPGSVVLLIGHHVAYAAALAAHLVGGPVHALELASHPVPVADGRPAHEVEEVDVLLILSGCSWLPWPWLQRLRPGACAVFPLLGVEGTALYWRLERPRAGVRWSAWPLALGEAEPWAEAWEPCAAALADALSHRLLDVKSVLPDACDGEDMVLVGDGGCFSTREVMP